MLIVSDSANAANWQNVQGKILSPDELDENPLHDVQEKKCWPARFLKDGCARLGCTGRTNVDVVAPLAVWKLEADNLKECVHLCSRWYSWHCVWNTVVQRLTE